MSNLLNNALDNSKRRSSKPDLPFYEQAQRLPPTSQIIKEAREKLHDGRRLASGNSVAYPVESPALVRTLGANRPFTPREEKRSLFGSKSTRPVQERPPSSFTYEKKKTIIWNFLNFLNKKKFDLRIGSKSFDTDSSSSRPLSATRLSPIEIVIYNFDKLYYLRSFKDNLKKIDFIWFSRNWF